MNGATIWNAKLPTEQLARAAKAHDGAAIKIGWSLKPVSREQRDCFRSGSPRTKRMAQGRATEMKCGCIAISAVKGGNALDSTIDSTYCVAARLLDALKEFLAIHTADCGSPQEFRERLAAARQLAESAIKLTEVKS